MFYNNFGKYGPISKIHQLIREKILYVYTQRLPPHLQYVATVQYLVKFENPKMLPKFHAERAS